MPAEVTSLPYLVPVVIRAAYLSRLMVLAGDFAPNAMQPYRNRSRLRSVMMEFEILNAGRGFHGTGLRPRARKGLDRLILLVIAVAMPVLWPQAGGASGQVRVFVTESTSWSVEGSDTIHEGEGIGTLKGGAKPQTAEIMKTIGKRRECRGVVVTINRDRADYILILERLGGSDILSKDNKMALFNRDGDMVASSSTRSLGNAVKNACVAIQHQQ